VVAVSSPALASLGIAGLIVLTFVPLHVIHPVRVTRLRGLTLALMALWGVLAIVALARNFDVAAPISVSLCAIALYIVGGDAVIRLLRPATT
jgi:phosphatidylcholine synthase